jgi:hypothetical protein
MAPALGRQDAVSYADAPTSNQERPVKKNVILAEGEASLTIPDELSLDSCDKLEQWLTTLLRTTRVWAMARHRVAELRTSEDAQHVQERLANVANDDEAPK